MPSTSGFFIDEVLGPLRPPAQIQQWDKDANDPLGFKHWESGSYKADAKIGLVGGFDAQLESGQVLNFGQVEATDIGFFTDTVVFTFNLGEVNENIDSFFDQMITASSVGTNFKAFNMKFWVGDLIAFSATGIANPVFSMRQSSNWLKGFSVVPGATDVIPVPSSLPSSGNIFSKSTSGFVSGVYNSLEFSNYIYLRGEFPSGVTPLGTYGGLGQKTFTFNFSYDWTDINATVLPGDLLPCDA